MPSRRIRIKISYDGTTFFGWQVQPDLPTVQSELERVVSGIEGAPVQVAGSGRTDAGVHALAQVAAFSIQNPIPCENLRRAMNRLLPHTIRVFDVEEADPAFHPRFDATGKHYQYRIWRDEICPPFDRPFLHHHPYPLDESAMEAAAPLFEGEHDFRAFAAADEKDGLGKSKIRNVFRSRLRREGAVLLFDVEGSGFLKHMVRNLMGTLVEVGKGNLSRADMATLMTPPYGKCGASVPAKGLFLISVHYGEARLRS